MNEDGELLPNGISLACSAGLNFTGIPEMWPNNCTELSEKCTVPSLMDESNLDSDPVVGTGVLVKSISAIKNNCPNQKQVQVQVLRMENKPLKNKKIMKVTGTLWKM